MKESELINLISQVDLPSPEAKFVAHLQKQLIKENSFSWIKSFWKMLNSEIGFAQGMIVILLLIIVLLPLFLLIPTSPSPRGLLQETVVYSQPSGLVRVKIMIKPKSDYQHALVKPQVDPILFVYDLLHEERSALDTTPAVYDHEYQIDLYPGYYRILLVSDKFFTIDQNIVVPAGQTQVLVNP